MAIKQKQTDFKKLSNLINQLEINYKCFKYLHKSFAEKLNKFPFENYLSTEFRREISYLQLCYWNHFSEITNIFYTLFMPSKRKEEISFVNIDENLTDDKIYSELIVKYKELKLPNIRNRTTAHKSAERTHSFFYIVQHKVDSDLYNGISNLVDSFLNWAYKKYGEYGKLVKIMNQGNIYSGVKTIFNNIENNLSLEDVRDYKYDNIIYEKILKTSINSSVLRNQRIKKDKNNKKENILENIRKYLKNIVNLEVFNKIKDENGFKFILDMWTHDLEENFIENKLKWGSARKAINILLEGLYFNYYTRKYIRHLSVYLEIPVDSKVHNHLKKYDKTLLDKFTIKNLDKNQNKKYQKVAAKLANECGLKRVELDAVLWMGMLD